MVVLDSFVHKLLFYFNSKTLKYLRGSIEGAAHRFWAVHLTFLSCPRVSFAYFSPYATVDFDVVVGFFFFTTVDFGVVVSGFFSISSLLILMMMSYFSFLLLLILILSFFVFFFFLFCFFKMYCSSCFPESYC